eukprot:CAMPEP_0179211802 /NCGR_PEP_ID=MMETSP0797-20121207/696_1 /TAXON_ID=47934 /ORGANISM="Dinophysis acuminata, Strain DAEP01" /LENGTH=248 /DNA_ID=CAMNT_0020917231 /DNA_START=13 /DNA_END=757 /DNA_ORIENTATION=+
MINTTNLLQPNQQTILGPHDSTIEGAPRGRGTKKYSRGLCDGIEYAVLESGQRHTWSDADSTGGEEAAAAARECEGCIELRVSSYDAPATYALACPSPIMPPPSSATAPGSVPADVQRGGPDIGGPRARGVRPRARAPAARPAAGLVSGGRNYCHRPAPQDTGPDGQLEPRRVQEGVRGVDPREAHRVARAREGRAAIRRADEERGDHRQHLRRQAMSSAGMVHLLSPEIGAAWPVQHGVNTKCGDLT